MRKLIVGNWKMNGSAAMAADLAHRLRDECSGLACEMVVCPPFPYVALVARLLEGSPIEVGGQDCHAAVAGSHTGDVSAGMLRDAGASWVILGHSERRSGHGETDAQVRAKAEAARKAGLRAIVAVGENHAERAGGHAEAIIERQARESLPDGFGGVLAYEPVWAIGAADAPPPGEIGPVMSAIRRFVANDSPVLYGGAVAPGNAVAILRDAGAGGMLIGRASLDADAFLAIARAAC